MFNTVNYLQVTGTSVNMIKAISKIPTEKLLTKRNLSTGLSRGLKFHTFLCHMGQHRVRKELGTEESFLPTKWNTKGAVGGWRRTRRQIAKVANQSKERKGAGKKKMGRTAWQR